VKKVTGIDFPVEIAPRRLGDPDALVASSEKIRKELGWNPTRTNIETIVASAWAWHSNHPKGFDSK
jgi:UDP-glucose 4-epimerase